MASEIPSSTDRPDPDALLKEVGETDRGRLKIFLGAAPGVGKTYAMLEEARSAKAEGRDVVVGLVETHGRRETERLLIGLETVPRKVLIYRGRSFPEMDLDAVLARKPELVLVDELAHTNVSGSRHPKRWQDIEEILNAGIDVYTTVNVQHLESLNDIVERISGIVVRETVPDAVLETADEIKIIDIAPDDLLKRLREGKVYVPEQARRALDRFFSKGNLTALRELALRVAAERVDRQMTDYMRAHGVTGTWPARERFLVCVGTGGDPDRLVRTGKRMADRNRAPWIVLHVRQKTPEDDAEQSAVDRALLLAESLGAETETLPPSSRLSDAIPAFARSKNVSRIVIGRRPKRFGIWPLRSLNDDLIENGAEFEFTVVCKEAGLRNGSSRPKKPNPRSDAPDLRYALGWGVTFVAVAVAFAWLTRTILPQANISLILLAGVLAAALRGSVPAAIASSLVAFLSYNFFFTEPHFSLRMYFGYDVVTVSFFLIFSIITGLLAARLRRQIRLSDEAALRTGGLYDFARRALVSTTIPDMAETIASHVSTEIGRNAAVIERRRSGEIEILAAEPALSQLPTNSRAAADWALRNGQKAGWTTDTLPDSPWLFIPLRAGDRTIGLLGIARGGGREILTEPQRRLVETLSEVSALILERGRMVSEVAEAQRYSETEKLRTALLSSVSHDLRTPLVSILGAATSLRDLSGAIRPEDQQELAETIVEEAERLNGFIQNLLDMTRLGYGALSARTEWVSLDEVVAAARRRVRAALSQSSISVEIAPEAAVVLADPILTSQALANLLDNGAKYAPPGGAIRIEAVADKDMVHILVADSGPGIPADLRERIFDLFYRVESGDRQTSGTGLGLAIARGFIEAMGGRLEACDPPSGSGGCFEIMLPRATPGSKLASPTKPEETP